MTNQSKFIASVLNLDLLRNHFEKQFSRLFLDEVFQWR